MTKDFTNNFKHFNKRLPQGVSEYKDNYESDEDSDIINFKSSDLELESDKSDSDNEDENLQINESDTDQSAFSEHSDDEDQPRSKRKHSKPVVKQYEQKLVTYKILQEESDFEEEM
jgi:hypothetical protein